MALSSINRPNDVCDVPQGAFWNTCRSLINRKRIRPWRGGFLSFFGPGAFCNRPFEGGVVWNLLRSCHASAHILSLSSCIYIGTHLLFPTRPLVTPRLLATAPRFSEWLDVMLRWVHDVRTCSKIRD